MINIKKHIEKIVEDSVERVYGIKGDKMEIKDDTLHEIILVLCYFIRHLSNKIDYNDIDRVKKLRKELLDIINEGILKEDNV